MVLTNKTLQLINGCLSSSGRAVSKIKCRYVTHFLTQVSSQSYIESRTRLNFKIITLDDLKSLKLLQVV